MTREPVVGTDPGPDADPAVAVPVHRRRVGLWVIIALIVIIDQVTKNWVASALAGRGPRHVIWTLQITLSHNSGMAFSTGRGIGPIIGAVAIVVVAGLAISARNMDSRLATAAAGLIAGGAIGNLVDRLFRGRGWLHGSVIDFIDFQWFPVFNVADAAITTGGGLFLLWSLLSSRETARQAGMQAGRQVGRRAAR